jgi:hypothetical protein
MLKTLTFILFLLIATRAGNVGAASADAACCGIESCHGLEVTCGPNQPKVCTALYAIGDFCREFLHCEVVGGDCTLITDESFQPCKDCISACTQKARGPEILGCEAECRKAVEPKAGAKPVNGLPNN